MRKHLLVMAISISFALCGFWIICPEKKSSQSMLTPKDAKDALLALIRSPEGTDFAHLAGYPLEAWEPFDARGQWKWAGISLDLREGGYSLLLPLGEEDRHRDLKCGTWIHAKYSRWGTFQRQGDKWVAKPVRR